MSKRIFYLAHPLDSRKKMKNWQEKIESEHYIKLINPFYDLDRKDMEMIDSGKHERYEKLDYIKLVDKDVNAIREINTEGIIAIIDGASSYGTLQEMVYAKLYNKKVMSIITNGHEEHPWLKYHSDNIYTSLGEFEEMLHKNKSWLKSWGK